MKGPCRDCKDRVIGCHSTCDKYLDYTEYLAKVRRGRNREKQFYEYLAENQFKSTRGRYSNKRKPKYAYK